MTHRKLLRGKLSGTQVDFTKLDELDAPLLFRYRDGAEFIRDELGMELDGIEAARDEATRGLADFAKEAIPGSVRRELAVECRDDADRDVLRAALWFEVAILTG